MCHLYTYSTLDGEQLFISDWLVVHLSLDNSFCLLAVPLSTISSSLVCGADLAFYLAWIAPLGCNWHFNDRLEVLCENFKVNRVAI